MGSRYQHMLIYLVKSIYVSFPTCKFEINIFAME